MYSLKSNSSARGHLSKLNCIVYCEQFEWKLHVFCKLKVGHKAVGHAGRLLKFQGDEIFWITNNNEHVNNVLYGKHSELNSPPTCHHYDAEEKEKRKIGDVYFQHSTSHKTVVVLTFVQALNDRLIVRLNGTRYLFSNDAPHIYTHAQILDKTRTSRCFPDPNLLRINFHHQYSELNVGNIIDFRFRFRFYIVCV